MKTIENKAASLRRMIERREKELNELKGQLKAIGVGTWPLWQGEEKEQEHEKISFEMRYASRSTS